MHRLLRHSFAPLFFLVCAGSIQALAQDHIVDFSGNVVPGKVRLATIERFLFNDKIYFNPEGKGGQKAYVPIHIKGYYLDRLKTFYATKFLLPAEEYAFFPEFTPGTDSVEFKKSTGLEVLANGKIKLYRSIAQEYVHTSPAQPFGTGSGHYAGTVASYYVEKDGKLIIFSFKYQEKGRALLPIPLAQPDQLREKQWLATFIRENQALTERLLYQEKELTSEFLEECIQHYNRTHVAGPSGSQTGDAGK